MNLTTGDGTRTYTATSEQDADAWLESLARQEGQPVIGAELDSRAGGRIRVTARIGDVTPTGELEDQNAAAAPATERVELRITVPGDDQDELDDALHRWSRELESEHGQALDFDVQPGDAPGLYVAAATVPAHQRRRRPRRSGGDVTPAAESTASVPAAEPARCGSCGGTLPVRTGAGPAPAVLQQRVPVTRVPATPADADPLRTARQLVDLRPGRDVSVRGGVVVDPRLQRRD